MAKSRKSREVSEFEAVKSGSPFDFLGDLDLIDIFLYIGVVLVTLVAPFLYSRLTTENFLTPKEFSSKIVLAFLGAIFCAKFIYEGRIRLARTKLDMPIALFFLLGVASLIWNYNFSSAVRDLRGTFLICLLIPIILNVVRQRWQFDGILWAMVFAGVATSLLGIMEAYNLYFRWDPQLGWFVFARDEIFSGNINYNAYYLPLFPQLARKDYSMMSIVSTFGNRNYLGTFSMFVAFIPIAFCFYYTNRLAKVFSFSMFFIMAFGLFITRCRAALLGILGGIAYMILMFALLNRDWRFFRRNVLFISIVVLVLAGIFLFAATTSSFSMFDKLKTTFTMDRKVSNVYERIWVWYGTYQSFAKSLPKWLLGSGFGSFKHFFPIQEPTTFDDDNKETFTSVTFRQTHNDWLQLVSELGLTGLGIILFLAWRFFKGIYISINDDQKDDPSEGGLQGKHVLLIGLGALMVAQLLAAIPDFPFHRIETALYAVIVLALVPLLGETAFFSKPLPMTKIAGGELALPFGLLGAIAGLMAINFEVVCWQADILVRDAEYRISTQDPKAILDAKDKLTEAIRKDALPGDPYLKMATIYQMQNKGPEAMEWAEKSWKNINFNARSTYHSTIFRMMHIAYHTLGDRNKALEYAMKGRFMTCGDARSIYYFYMGKIALDLGDLAVAEWSFKRAVNFPQFGVQAGANLAVVLATLQKWDEAYTLAASISASVNDTDPTMLDILGIAASNMGQLATAEAYLRKALALKDDQPIYKRDLGLTLLRMNKAIEGRKYLEDAFAAPGLPANIKAEVEGVLASTSVFQRDTGMNLINAGKKDEAIKHFQGMLEARVLPGNMRNEIASVLASLGGLNAEKIPAATGTAPQSAPQGITSSSLEMAPPGPGKASSEIPQGSPPSSGPAVTGTSVESASAPLASN